MSFHSEKVVKSTRKDHKCDGCGLKIPKGSSCFVFAGVYEDDFWDSRMHKECVKKQKEINVDCEPGEPWMDLCEMGNVYPHESFKAWQDHIRMVYSLGGPE